MAPSGVTKRMSFVVGIGGAAWCNALRMCVASAESMEAAWFRAASAL